MARKSKKNKPEQQRPKTSAPTKAPTGAAMWVARICFAAAAAVAAWLLFYTLTEKPIAGCGPGSPCDRVMGSSWAYWLEIPVSAPALAVYLTLLGCAIAVTSPRETRNRRAWMLGCALSLAVLFVASWFVYLQLHVIKSVCKFCTTAHALSVIGAIAFLAKAPGPQFSMSRIAGLAIAGVLPVAALIAGQELKPHKTNVVSLYRGSLKFDLRDAPIIGSPDAKAFIIDLFDYTCPDCHDMHARLIEARQRLTNSFAIIALPCPLEADCNPHVKRTSPKHKNACEFAKLGMAMRRCGSDLFQKYDDWFFSRGSIPTLEAAREQARSLAGEAPLNNALADPWVGATIQKGVTLYDQNGRLTKSYRIPQLIIGNELNIGPVRNTDELVRLLNEHLHDNPAVP